MKIIAFTFAGGNKHSFQIITKNIENFTVIEYPGRGFRMGEDLITDIDSLIEDLFQKVKSEISQPQDYIIYGHSMGALLGYLLCQKIEELGFQKPAKLVVSGRKPPVTKRENLFCHLPDNLFWDEVVKIGGIPDELINHQELIEFFTPILKADLTIVEVYKYQKKNKLNIPIDVFYGSEESTEDEMQGWEEESNEKISITQMKGDHFFIFKHVTFFTQYFKNLTQKLTI
ncbi:surfactin synthase thioesterase subunit [Flavobacterium sp. 270]|uniref:thioesterase II family protein n=1 Tax=Flavobacterium sp. 270 TaxID=2512114 RepID=UPI001066A644|nr:thioesterase domain-containing protein [Flavobacterium sp. 270]TDW48167.1 surfactin synthase thioesterase subunit [Flavobacterium sp. 270]